MLVRAFRAGAASSWDRSTLAPLGMTLDYLPEELLTGVTNVADFARVLVLDKWTCNADGRQAIYYRRTQRSQRHDATFIDQGYCFNASEWTFPDYPLRGVFADNCVYESVTGWKAFEPALTKAQEMDSDAIWRCAAEIPEEWYEGDRNGLSGWWKPCTVAVESFGS